jgi:hypothetical protein
VRKLLVLGMAIAAGYTAARALLDRERPEETPPQVRERLEYARTRLEHGRERTREVLAAAREGTEDATRELVAEYHRRAGRDTSADAARPDDGLLRINTDWRR